MATAQKQIPVTGIPELPEHPSEVLEDGTVVQTLDHDLPSGSMVIDSARYVPVSREVYDHMLGIVRMNKRIERAQLAAQYLRGTRFSTLYGLFEPTCNDPYPAVKAEHDECYAMLAEKQAEFDAAFDNEDFADAKILKTDIVALKAELSDLEAAKESAYAEHLAIAGSVADISRAADAELTTLTKTVGKRKSEIRGMQDYIQDAVAFISASLGDSEVINEVTASAIRRYTAIMSAHRRIQGMPSGSHMRTVTANDNAKWRELLRIEEAFKKQIRANDDLVRRVNAETDAAKAAELSNGLLSPDALKHITEQRDKACAAADLFRQECIRAMSDGSADSDDSDDDN